MKMWAYYDIQKATYHHIYRTEDLVRICSPDGFDTTERNGVGEVVQVEISHLTTVAPDTKDGWRCKECGQLNFFINSKCLQCKTCR